MYVGRYSFGFLLNDILSGLKIFLLLTPIMLSLAFFCGATPAQGMITCSVAALVGVFLGGSKYQISAVALPVCVITFEIILKYQYKGILYTAIFVAFMLILFGLLRIGKTLKYMSYSFISALLVYVALSIITNQLQYILGIGGVQSSQGVSENISLLIGNLENLTLDGTTTAVAFIVPLLASRIFFKGFLSFFIYVVAGCAVAYLLNIGIVPGIFEIKTVGKEIMTGQPLDNIFTISKNLPSQTFLANALEYAFVVSLIIGAETCFATNIASCVTGDKKVQHNAELISTGISNFVSVACGGLFVSPSISFSLKNIEYKSKTVISMLIVALLSYGFVMFSDVVLRYVPIFCISSVLVVYAASELFNKKILQYFNLKSNESYIFLLTLALAIYFGFVPAAIVGFTMSSLFFANRMTKIKDATVHTTKDHDSGAAEFMTNKNMLKDTMKIPKHILDKIEVIQVSNVLFLNIAKVIEEALSMRGRFPSVLIIYFKNAPYLDGEGLAVLKRIVKNATKKESIVIVSGTNGMLLDILKQKAADENNGDVFGYIMPNFREAIQQSVKRLSAKRVSEAPPRRAKILGNYTLML